FVGRNGGGEIDRERQDVACDVAFDGGNRASREADDGQRGLGTAGALDGVTAETVVRADRIADPLDRGISEAVVDHRIAFANFRLATQGVVVRGVVAG